MYSVPAYCEAIDLHGQFESMEASHLVHLILDSKNKNNLFYSPIPDTAQNILDIGTGTGGWCRDVAEKYPGGKQPSPRYVETRVRRLTILSCRSGRRSLSPTEPLGAAELQARGRRRAQTMAL